MIVTPPVLGSGAPLRVGIMHATLPRPDRKPGGVEVHVHRLAQHLVAAGHAVHVLASDVPPGDATYEHRPLPVRPAWRGPIGRLTLAPLALNAADVRGLDVLHLHGDDWFYVRRTLPTVRTFHGTALQEARSATTLKRRLLMYVTFPLEVLASRLATASYSVSGSGASAYRAVGTLPCGVDIGAPSLPSAERKEAILFIGTWDGRKRGRLLWEAFVREIRPVRPHAELWMVADRLEPAPGVRLFRRPTDEGLEELFRTASVFCMPSEYEGLGIPYVEAMAHGLPVVATPNVGAEEVLSGGRYGRIVRPAALGTTLAGLLADPASRAEMSAAGRRRAGDFDWSRIVRRHEEAYRAAILRGRRR